MITKRRLVVGLVLFLAATVLTFNAVAENVKVNVITWDTATARGIQKVIPDFVKETGIDVNMEIYGEPELRTKVMMDLAAGTSSWDIFLLDNWLTAQYAEAGYILSLDDLIKYTPSKYESIKDFAPIYLNALRYKGKLWGLPYYGHVGILMYRKDIFEQKGIKVPTTTSELLATARKLNDPPNMYGIAFRAIRGEDNPIITTSWTWAFGGRWLDEQNRPAVNSSEFIKGVTWVHDILKYAPPDVSSYSWVEVEKSFTSGKVAMIFDASDFVGRIENPAQSSIAGKIGYALAPSGPVASHYPSELFCAGMAINKNTEHRIQAFQFLEYMTNSEVQLKTALDSWNTGVTVKSVLTSQEFLNKFPGGVKVMLEAQRRANWDYMPHITVYSELCDIIGTHISAVIVGDEQPKQSMDRAAAEMTTVLVNYGMINK